MSNTASRAEFQEFIAKLLPNVDKLTPNQQHHLYQTLTKIRELDKMQDARDHLLPFMEYMWPGFIQSWHHVVLCNLLEEMYRGELLRAAISTPPRYTKSQTLSIYFPAWIMGKQPGEATKVIQASNTHKLAERFGRFCKNAITSPRFADLFPNAKLSKESKAAGSFMMVDGAEYFAAGVGGALAGRGALYLLVDDPFSEQDILTGNAIELFDMAEEWYMTALQRLQPNGRACVLHTRWGKSDLIGRIEARSKKNPTLEQYRIVNIPALDEHGESTFPGYWKTELLRETRARLLEKTPHLWFAQYQQNPTSDEISIIKRDWWRKYEKRDKSGDFITPPCTYTLMSFDTAYTAKKRSNPTACTVWGIFEMEESGVTDNYIILLYSFQKKIELPDLKEESQRLVKQWEPDGILVEAASSGPWVLEEFRRAGIPAQGVRPKPGEDKMSRLNSVADIFASGKVFYIPTPENEEAIQQIVDFPAGDADDFVDTTSQALRRFRQGGFVSTKTDYKDPDDQPAIIDRGYY